MKQRQWFRWTLAILVAGSLALAGCGDDGDTGPQGPPGPPGGSAIDASATPEAFLADIDVVSEITDVTIASPPVVTFTVKTADGTPIVGIQKLWEESASFVRFTIAKLVPGTNGDPDAWVAYTRDTVNDGSTEPDYDRGEVTGGLVDNGDGSYTFTFNTDVTAVTGVPYEPTLVHRVAGQIGSGSVALEAQNLVYDFTPSTGAPTVGKKVAVEDSCNECHDNLSIHGRRFKIDYCVNCHNPDLAIAPVSGVAEGNLSFMIHKIHAAGNFEALNSANFREHVTHIGYPQELANCRKCHNGADAATPDGDNWMVPNKAACMGCHEGAHPADVANNAGCTACHDDNTAPTPVTAHITPNATENNPALLPGQREIAYNLVGATINAADELVISFNITSDGTKLDLTALPADLTAASNRPSFLLAWAEPQDGIATPADFNNLGNVAAQPTSLALTGGALACVAGDCTLTVANPFPVGATLRTIGLQGYFQQDLSTPLDGTADVALHTQSAVITVTGDSARRAVADSAGCAACHEIFEGHGGNRVLTADGGVQICTLCHVPNLSSGGRTVDISFPEASNNLKDMIHGIHGASVRTSILEFVRNRGGARLYAFLNEGVFDSYVPPAGTFVEINAHLMTFPGNVSDCTNCHLPGTYEAALPANLLPSTQFTEDATPAVVPADVTAARATVPNANDLVLSPTVGACMTCHDSPAAIAHAEQNGGAFEWERATYDAQMPFESCVVCHGDGSQADVNLVHGL